MEYKNKDDALQAIKSGDFSTFSNMPEVWKKDKDVTLEAIRNFGGLSIKFASPEIRANREVALEAVSNYGASLQFLTKSLQNDKGIVLEAVKSDLESIKFASEEIKKIIGHGDEVTELTKAIDREKLSNKISNEVYPKSTQQAIRTHKSSSILKI